MSMCVFSPTVAMPTFIPQSLAELLISRRAQIMYTDNKKRLFCWEDLDKRHSCLLVSLFLSEKSKVD